jgi:hypothetical protein
MAEVRARQFDFCKSSIGAGNVGRGDFDSLGNQFSQITPYRDSEFPGFDSIEFSVEMDH